MLPILGSLTPKLSWYIARSSGIDSWLLHAASVIWGLVLSARVLNRHTAPGWLLDLHRYFGALSIVLTLVHIAGLVGDNWLHVGWGDILVPMASKYRPGAVAWGVVALYLLLAIELTSLVRSRLPRRLWRATHYLAFPLFVACTVHGIQAGTDAGVRTFGWLMVMGVSVVAVLAVIRIVATRDARSRRSARAGNADAVGSPETS